MGRTLKQRRGGSGEEEETFLMISDLKTTLLNSESRRKVGSLPV